MANQIMFIEPPSGDVDLLQLALAGATDELIETDPLEQHQVLNQTELLNILQGDSSDSQTIQLTAEQAAALGLQIETDSGQPSEAGSNSVGDPLEIRSVQSVEDTTNSEDIDIEAGEPIQFVNGLPNSILVQNNGFTPIIINKGTIAQADFGKDAGSIQFIHRGGVITSTQDLSANNVHGFQTSKESLQNLIFDSNTNTRIVYRTVFPEELDLLTPKRGLVKRGRPRKSTQTEEKREPSPEVPLAKATRTRSGRLTKPPRHKHFRPLREIDIENTKSENTEPPPPPPVEIIKEDPPPVEDPPKGPVDPVVYQKRSIPSQIRCPTCNKAYLGLNRLEKHLKFFPSHGPLPTTTTNLWQIAMKYARKAPNPGVTILRDISSLIESLQKVSSKLILPNEENGPKFDINETLSQVLRIPVGTYTINDSILDPIPKTVNSNTNQPEVGESISEPIVSQNDEDTGHEPMMVDTNGHSDGLMSVDQLVNERLYSLTAAELSAPLTETLVEPTTTTESTNNVTGSETNGLNIDLSTLDLFQFNPS